MKYLIGMLLAVLLSAVYFFSTQVRVENIFIEPPELSNALQPPLPPRISSLSVRATASMEAIQLAVNDHIPKKIRGSKKDPTDALTKDTLSWTVNIGAVSVKKSGGALGVSVPISGKVNLNGTFAWFSSFSETVNLAGTIVGAIKPTINPDWSIGVDATARINLTKAEADLFGSLIKVSFKGDMQKILNREINKLLPKLNEHLSKDGELRNEMEALWDSIHVSEQISDMPPIQLSLKPQSIGTSMLSISDSDLSLTAGVKFLSNIHLQSEPVSVTLSPLPDHINNLPDDVMSLSVPVAIKLSELGSIASADLGLPHIDVPGGTAEIGALSLSGDNGQLYLRMDVIIRNSLLSKSAATIYLLGEPLIDQQKQEIRFDSLEYDLKTKDVLTNVASFLLKPLALEELRKRAVFRLSDTHRDLVSLANSELSSLISTLPEGLNVSAEIADSNISELVVDDGWIVAIVEARGRASIEINDLGSF